MAKIHSEKSSHISLSTSGLPISDRATIDDVTQVLSKFMAHWSIDFFSHRASAAGGQTLNIDSLDTSISSDIFFKKAQHWGKSRDLISGPFQDHGKVLNDPNRYNIEVIS